MFHFERPLFLQFRVSLKSLVPSGIFSIVVRQLCCNSVLSRRRRAISKNCSIRQRRAIPTTAILSSDRFLLISISASERPFCCRPNSDVMRDIGTFSTKRKIHVETASVRQRRVLIKNEYFYSNSAYLHFIIRRSPASCIYVHARGG